MAISIKKTATTSTEPLLTLLVRACTVTTNPRLSVDKIGLHVVLSQPHATARRLHDSYLQLRKFLSRAFCFSSERCRCSMNIDTMLTTIKRTVPHSVFFPLVWAATIQRCYLTILRSSLMTATSHFAVPAKEKVEPQKGLWLQSTCRKDAIC